MDLFTQNMINRTKQRQEMLLKTKTPSLDLPAQPVGSTSPKPRSLLTTKVGDDNPGLSKSSPLKANEVTKEKENICSVKERIDRSGATSSPKGNSSSALKRHLGDVLDNTSDPVEKKSFGNLGLPMPDSCRKSRFTALADQVNDWEDESFRVSKQVTSTPETNKKVTPLKRDGRLLGLSSKKSATGHSSSNSSGLETSPEAELGPVTKNESAACVKPVVLDESLLNCLESQGFTPSLSHSRLIYEFDKEQEEIAEEAAKSWTYADGTTLGGALENKNEKSPSVASTTSPKKTVKGSHLLRNATKSSDKSPRSYGAVNRFSPSVSRTKPVENTETPANGPTVSVLERAAQFDPRPRPVAKDPTELSLAERKAMFEGVKSRVSSAKPLSPGSRLHPSRSATPKKFPVPVPATSTKAQESPATISQNSRLRTSVTELNQSGKHAQENIKIPTGEQVNIPKQQPIDQKSIEPVARPNSGQAPLQKIVDGQNIEKPSRRKSEEKIERTTFKEPYAGLLVKPIKVSPPKPGKLYPCLSDIEATTENDSEESMDQDKESYSPFRDKSSAATVGSESADDLDSSFTVEILGRAGLSQYLSTPKAKIQEVQLNKQLLMRSIHQQESIAALDFDESREDAENVAGVDSITEHHKASPTKELHNTSVPSEEEVVGGSMPLYHSISEYRKQQSQSATPVRQIRNPEIQPTSISEEYEAPTESNRITIQQQIRNLQEEINIQHNVMAQASQALNLCRSTAEFSGSSEQVEGERLLLVAYHKKQAAVNEIQRLKTEAAMKKPSQGFESHGVLSLSNLRLPLKPDFLAMLSKGGDDFIHYFIVLIRNRGQVIPLQMVSTGDGIQDGALNFPNLIQLSHLSADFEVSIEVYALQTRKEKLNHELKYHIKKESSKLRLTPKKHQSRHDSRVLSKSSMASPAKSNTIRSSSFGLVGCAKITTESLRRREWILENVPVASPIVGTLLLKIQCHSEAVMEQRGFLTVFEDVAGFGAWHRRWCRLTNYQLMFWRYPDDEKRKDPMGQINLRRCVTEKVDVVSHDICARPNTFLLVTVREPQDGDKNSLIATSYSHRTALRHLISADSKEERMLWCRQINHALTNLRCWDTETQEFACEDAFKQAS